MICNRGKVGFLLILMYLHTQPVFRHVGAQKQPKKNFLDRLKRLDEQFRRFQEDTVSRLQDIANKFNLPSNINDRFQVLTAQYQNISILLNDFQITAANDLSSLKSWTKKLQRKTRNLNLKLAILERTLNDQKRMTLKEAKKQKLLLFNLTQQVRDHRDRIGFISANQNEMQGGFRGLQDALKKQLDMTARLQEQVKALLQKNTFSSRGSSSSGDPLISNRTPQNPPSRIPTPGLEQGRRSPPSKKKIHLKPSNGKRVRDRLPLPRPTQPYMSAQNKPKTRPGPKMQKEPDVYDLAQLPLRHRIPQHHHKSKKTGAICNVNSMLHFPSNSIRNYVTFKKSFLTGIHELSICTWLKIDVSYVGTLLSYATEENDNKLVLYGRSSKQGSLDFVVGDPAYRELPADNLLDSRWHHLCIIWSSIEGRFWHYTDHRLISTGSKFQKGYEIPEGGSIILGQEQDYLGGGFDEAEAFVGRMAGFMVWNRVLSPGEVSGIATGKGIPRGTVLSLDDIDQLNGSVQHVNCRCLEHCM
ncbi:pentraxin-4-like [Megalops cyprinoides]|uniref:pentraxin-4-like n=1 Tax=Megalops cyprinoides TaxID=118141 RepID=UPI001864BB3D|nr:pentraxin-4-like [Megalops cyprinoides]